MSKSPLNGISDGFYCAQCNTTKGISSSDGCSTCRGKSTSSLSDQGSEEMAAVMKEANGGILGNGNVGVGAENGT
jgi:hypothetical protein